MPEFIKNCYEALENSNPSPPPLEKARVENAKRVVAGKWVAEKSRQAREAEKNSLFDLYNTIANLAHDIKEIKAYLKELKKD